MMKYFKTRQGAATPHLINRENYERYTMGLGRYKEHGADGTRYLGICPACDNPVTLVGLYRRDPDKEPYGKHRGADTALARHNERAYQYCPFASHNRVRATKDMLRDELTDFERGIYYCLRDNFDHAVFLIQDVTGIYIGEKTAKIMLENYLAARGYMYYHVTPYNIPWMLLYFGFPMRVYRSRVRKDSELREFLSERPDILLEDTALKAWSCVEKRGRFIAMDYAVLNHRQDADKDGWLRESIELHVAEQAGDSAEPRSLCKINLPINERRFPKLVNSEKAKMHRNQTLLDIARELMPDI